MLQAVSRSLIAATVLAAAATHAHQEKCSSPDLLALAREVTLLVQEDRLADASSRLKALAGGGVDRCHEVLMAAARLQRAQGDLESAKETARLAREAAGSRDDRLAASVLETELILDGLPGHGRKLRPRHLDDLGRAEQLIRSALRFESEAPPNSRFLLAQIHEWSGRPTSARFEYREYLRRHPAGELASRAQERLEALDGGEETRFVVGQIQPPRPKYTPSPHYPERARRLMKQGAVIVRAVIDRRGRVQRAEVLRGIDPVLDAEALKTVKKWRFKPARLPNGQPVQVYFTLTVNFNLY